MKRWIVMCMFMCCSVIMVVPAMDGPELMPTILVAYAEEDLPADEEVAETPRVSASPEQEIVTSLPPSAPVQRAPEAETAENIRKGPGRILTTQEGGAIRVERRKAAPVVAEAPKKHVLNLDDARTFLDAGSYDDAIRVCTELLKKDPYQPEVTALLNRAREYLDRRVLRASRNERMDDVRRFMEEERLDDAIRVLTRLLEVSPMDKEVQKYLNRCRRLRFDRRMTESQLKHDTEFENRMLEVEKAAIPYVEPRSLAKLGKGSSEITEIPDVEETPEIKKFRAQLAEVYVSLDFKNADLREVVRYLAEVSDINIVIDESALLKTSFTSVQNSTTQAPKDDRRDSPKPPDLEEDLPDELPNLSDERGASRRGSRRDGDDAPREPKYVAPAEPEIYTPKVSVYLRNIPILKAMEILLRTKGLDYRLDTDFIWITTQHNLSMEKMVTRVYTIKHAVGQFASFKASPINNSILRSNSDPMSGVDDVFSGNGSQRSLENALQGLESSSKSRGEAEVAGDLVSTLQRVVPQPPGASMTLYVRTGKLIVRNSPNNLRTLEGLLESLDVSSLQVSLEVRILEVSDFTGTDIGVEYSASDVYENDGTHSTSSQWSTMAGQLGFGRSLTAAATDGFNYRFLKIDTDTTEIAIRALTAANKATVLSAPRLVCLNNQTANIRISTNSNYIRATTTTTTTTDGVTKDNVTQQIGEIPEGIVLEITPNVSSDNKTIRMTVHPSVVELLKLDTITSGDTVTQLPTITQRTIDTTVSLESGTTLAMGGLMKNAKQDRKQGVPGLSRIPGVGRLFRTNNDFDEKRNLVIFITATILDSRGNPIQQGALDIASAPMTLAPAE